jgi:hypothetical protein
MYQISVFCAGCEALDARCIYLPLLMLHGSILAVNFDSDITPHPLTQLLIPMQIPLFGSLRTRSETESS